MSNFYDLISHKRKENLKFVLSSSFIDDAGKPIVWEMRQMNEIESAWLNQQGEDPLSLLWAISTVLINPDFGDKEFLVGFSEQTGQEVHNAAEALGTLLTYAELFKLRSLFEKHNGLDTPFLRRVNEFADILEKKTEIRARLVHLALQNHNISPAEYFALTVQEQAFIAASDLVYQKELKKAQQKAAAIRRR